MKAAKTKQEANEINMTYWKADNERYKNMPGGLGYQVNLSNNHTTENLCDVLVGVYPAWFVFVGHDDQCMCFVTPVLSSDKEFDRYIKAVEAGTDSKFKFKGTVTEMPENFKNWVKENDYFLNKWDFAPLIITDNFTAGNIKDLINGKILV